MKIVEVSGGTTTSTKQFVWCGDERYEVRDASGNLVNQYFARGQVNFSGGVGTNYFYTRDHLGSVREMTDSSGNVVAELAYDPYGRVSQLSGSMAPDFQYAGYYFHAPSGLCLTRTRAYIAALARFLNRDPIEEAGGGNLYGYVSDPISFSDSSGLEPLKCRIEKHRYSDQPYETRNGNVPEWQQPPYTPPVAPPEVDSDPGLGGSGSGGGGLGSGGTAAAGIMGIYWGKKSGYIGQSSDITRRTGTSHESLIPTEEKGIHEMPNSTKLEREIEETRRLAGAGGPGPSKPNKRWPISFKRWRDLKLPGPHPGTMLMPFEFFGPIIRYQWEYIYGGGHAYDI